ncbi:unnamed protein product [Closterium sp. NIES-54]
MTLRPSTAPQRVPLPSVPASSLPDGLDPESDSLRAASPTVTRFLATPITDPLFESSVASALIAKLVDFSAAYRLDYATSLVAESASASVCPPSIGGECALGTDVLEDRQEEFECFAAAVPHLVSMLLAPEGDPDAPDIPTPRSYAEAIEGPYSSQWQAAMDAEMASWKSTGTYVDEVPPPGANISHMVQQVLQRFGFTYSSPQSTPLRTGHSLSAPPSDESVEPSGLYPELVGCLMCLMTCTRPDLAYPLSLLACYVVPGRARVVLTGHADASWVDDLATQRSSQGYTFTLGSVSWRSTRSSSVLSSSCEAEIYAGAMAAQELRWLTYLLTDLGEAPRSPPVLYVDNKAMFALYQEHRLEHRTKHIALRYFLARELQQRVQLRLAYVASQANTADVFTKALQPCDHQRFCTVLGLEDANLLRHALQCGTKQWGDLGRSGQLKRSNKSCCNCYIFLRRRFIRRLQQQVWKGLPRGGAPPRLASMQSQVLQQQQQEEGAGSRGSSPATLTFGGLSFEECKRMFLSPNDNTPFAEPEAIPSSHLRPAVVTSDHTGPFLISAAAFSVVTIPAATACDAATIPTVASASSALDAATLTAATAGFNAAPAPIAAADGACKPAALSTAAVASAAISDATAAFCKLMRETSLCPGPAEQMRDEPLCTDPAVSDATAAFCKLMREMETLLCANPAELTREALLCADPAEAIREALLCADPAEATREALLCADPAEATREALLCADPAEATREALLCADPAEATREALLCADPAEGTMEALLCADPAEATREALLCADPSKATREALLCADPAEVTREALLCTDPAEVTREAFACADPAARSLRSKRPREGCAGHAAAPPVLGCTMQRPQWLDNGCAQQGKRRRVQPTLRPHVGSESALPDDMLLGFNSREAGYGAREPG